MNGKQLLSNLKFNESYSKFDKVLKRKESWEESCEDVMRMHYNKFSKLANWNEIKPYYEFALDSYKNMNVLASQRNLQFREKHILKHNARLFNCSSLYIDRIEAFKQIFYILLCGCGVGYSVEKRYINKLPLLKKRNESEYKVFAIEDSIEGWSLALDALLNSYFEGTSKIIFDYSKIRPKGSLIADEFLAPGYEGLEKSFLLIDKILQDKVNNNDFKLTSLNCHDIICLISDSVLSGGVRRCLAGDSEVLTKKGLIKMKDISIDDEVLTHTGEYKKVVAKINNGKRKLLKITTNCGDYFSTENHVWATAKNLDGDINWKLTSDLKKDDVFIYNNNNIVGIDTCLPKSNDFDVPELDTDMAWFIGYFLGNGSCSKRIRKNNNEDNKFRISYPSNYNLEEKIHTQFKRFCKDFNIFSKGSSKEITSSKKIYANYFLEHFKQPNTEILIPNCIKQAKEEIRIAFIAGLLDSDGSVREEIKNNKGTGQISIVCSKYYNFCRSVQSLISLSGIPTKLKIDNRGNSFSVKTIDSYFRKTLIEKLSKFSIKLRDDYVLNDITKEKYGIVYPSYLCNKIGQKSKLFNNNHIASYKKVYLENNIGTGFIPVIIKSISSYKDDVVYDIEVEDNHSFYIDGVLTHNSALISLFDKDDELMLKCKTGDWWLKTPWRARANNSAKLLKSELTKEEFDNYKESIKQYGEPGIVLVDDIEFCGNPCVTKDTIVTTNNGSFTVEELIGKPFIAIIDGKEYESSPDGFWYNGIKDVYLLETVEGYTLKLTDNHKLKTKDGWKKLKNITINDKIFINNHFNLEWGEVSTEDFDKGWLIGNLVGDGTFNDESAVLRYWGKETYLADYAKDILNKYFKKGKPFSANTKKDIVSLESKGLKNLAQEYGIYPKDKTPNSKIESTSSSFYKGFISGIFDADGSVQGNLEKGVSIRLSQNNLDILRIVQRMLLKLGIRSKIYKNRQAEGLQELPDGKGGKKDYFCKAIHELTISRQSLLTFSDRVGFKSVAKQDILTTLLSKFKRKFYKDNMFCKINNVSHIGEEEVFDVSINEINAFDANGIIAHNCLEIGFIPKNPNNGNSCVSFCNLNEIIGSKCDTEEKFYQACKAAAIIGTFQASYTNFPFLGKDTEELVSYESLLGVSITGFMNNPKILLNPEILEKGVKVIKETNDIVAKLIGINPAARLTCTKP